MGEAFAPLWEAFTDTLGVVDWTSPWTWFVIVAALMLFGAAQRQ